MKMFNAISARILIGYIAILLIFCLSAVTVGFKYATAKTTTQTFIEETLPSINALQMLMTATRSVELGAYSLYGLTIEQSEFLALLQTSESNIKAPLILLGDAHPEVKSQLDSMNVALETFRIVMNAASIDWDAARNALSSISMASAHLQSNLNAILADETALAEQRSNHIISSLTTVQIMNWLLSIPLLLVLLLAYLYSKKSIARPVEGMADNLVSISNELDLSRRLPVLREDEIGRATQSVNHLLTSFSQAITNVGTTVSEVQATSDTLNHVTEQSDNTIQTLEKQIESLTQQMSSLEAQIEASVSQSHTAAAQSRTGAELVNEGAQQVNKTSENIASLVDEIELTSDMLSKLQASGEQVSTVVRTVSEIAEQTNLLALNAAIEAARAGESGRGFAVVADEVRTLANRTRQSTEEIDKMVSVIMGAIQDTVATMSKNKAIAKTSMTHAATTVDELSSTRETILSLSHINQEIAVSAQSVQAEMALLRGHVADFRDLGDIVHEGSHKTRVQANELASTAEKLAGLIKRFRF